MEYELMMQEIARIALWAVTFMVAMPAFAAIVGLFMFKDADGLEDRASVAAITLAGMALPWSIGFTACL